MPYKNPEATRKAMKKYRERLKAARDNARDNEKGGITGITGQKDNGITPSVVIPKKGKSQPLVQPENPIFSAHVEDRKLREMAFQGVKCPDCGRPVSAHGYERCKAVALSRRKTSEVDSLIASIPGLSRGIPVGGPPPTGLVPVTAPVPMYSPSGRRASGYQDDDEVRVLIGRQWLVKRVSEIPELDADGQPVAARVFF